MPSPYSHLPEPVPTVEAASRLSRLLARIVDGIVWFAVVPLLFLSYIGVMAALVLVGAIFIGQLWLLVTQGQTIGKRFLGIYIMRSDGSIPNVGWLLLREFAIPGAVALFRWAGHNDPTFVGQVFQSMLGLLCLVDILFIFSPTRRCLHDLVAGTHVVVAN
jgi:uncharacterized RDD family membrane protein YckC